MKTEVANAILCVLVVVSVWWAVLATRSLRKIKRIIPRCMGRVMTEVKIYGRTFRIRSFENGARLIEWLTEFGWQEIVRLKPKRRYAVRARKKRPSLAQRKLASSFFRTVFAEIDETNLVI